MPGRPITGQHKAFHHARQANVCLCGAFKQAGYLFCLRCNNKLEYEVRQQIKVSASFNDRVAAWLEACSILGLDATWEKLCPVFLSEEQMDGLFLGAHLYGKRIAIAALLDWSRSKPQNVAPPESNDPPTDEEIIHA